MAEVTPYYLKPGLHSRNFARFAEPERSFNPITKWRTALLMTGVLCLGYFGYTWADQWLYQSYQSWAFDHHAVVKQEPVPAEGSVIGRVRIPRLNIAAMVRQGVDDSTLKDAVGHVPSTALAGQVGNFAIAAHRDTLFRGLKDIKIGDIVTFQSQTGEYSYAVTSTKIVKPTDVSVLRADGAGDKPKLMTLITCYPFYFVGSAPNRFIVQARLIQPRAQLAN